jgi:hypothetical protein
LKKQFFKILKRILKFFNFCLKISRLFVIAIFGSIFVYTAIVDFASANSHDLVHTQYERYEHSNIYYQTDIADIDDINMVYDTLDKLPKGLLRRIERDWLILISEESPFETFETQNKIVGTTYYKDRVIWMQPGFDIHHFFHETGHVYDIYAGELSKSNEFYNIYMDNWKQYQCYHEDDVIEHAVSDASEYFAEMFAEYIMHNDYLKENNSAIYDYINKNVNESWRMSDIGMFICRIQRLQFNVVDSLEDISNRIDSQFKIIKSKIRLAGKIKEVDDHKTTFDFEYVDAEAIFNTVLAVIENPHLYQDEIKVKVNESDFEIYWEANSALQIYFGDCTKDFVRYMPEVINGKAQFFYIFNKVDILKAETYRTLYAKRIDEVIVGLKKGSERQLLTQVALYMYQYADYGHPYEDATLKQFWEEKYCNSLANAIVFKQFANRLGIQCDIVKTPLYTGNDHYFNIVYIDDQIYYYDVSRVNESKFDIKEYDLIVFDTNKIG